MSQTEAISLALKSSRLWLTDQTCYESNWNETHFPSSHPFLFINKKLALQGFSGNEGVFWRRDRASKEWIKGMVWILFFRATVALGNYDVNWCGWKDVVKMSLTFGWDLSYVIMSEELLYLWLGSLILHIYITSIVLGSVLTLTRFMACSTKHPSYQTPSFFPFLLPNNNLLYSDEDQETINISQLPQ